MKKIFAIAAIMCLCSTAFAQSGSPPAAATPNAPPPAQEPAAANGVVGDRNAAYTDRIAPEQIVVLDANGDKFQARHIGDLSGQPRGAAIILHDSGQHPNWPFTVAALIDDLPLHGWDTLSIELPLPDDNAKPATQATNSGIAATTGGAASTATATPQTAANNAAPAANSNGAVEQKAQARIAAAINYFAQQKQTNITLIGFGSGAIRAAENLRALAAANTASPGNTAPISALVIISPQQKLAGIEMDLPKLLPLTAISTLDIVLDNDPLTRADAEARRRAVLHQRSRIYTRLEMAPVNNTGDAQSSTMVKRVRSWLQKNVSAAIAEPDKSPR